MQTTTLPNVVEPTFDWTPPVDQNAAVHEYWAHMMQSGDALARAGVDPVVVSAVDVEAFCGVNYARSTVEHWTH